MLKSIMSNGGYVTNKELPEIARLYPCLPLVIKWEAIPRSSHYARDCQAIIKEAEAKGEYAREVFISADNLDYLRKKLKL